MAKTSDLALIIEEWLAGRPVNIIEKRLVSIGCNPAATARKVYHIRHNKTSWTTEWWADAIVVAIGHPEYFQDGTLELYNANPNTGQGIKV